VIATGFVRVGGALALRTKETEKRPRQDSNAVDRSGVLRKVMEVLSVKGFSNASVADLTSTAGVDYGTLHKTFGGRDQILRAAIQSCADAEASLAQEPLLVLPTGREAILSMLEENMRLRRHWPRYCGCLFTFNAFVIPRGDAALQHFLSERRRSLSKQIRLRLLQSVTEGELPEDTNCEVVANLCLTLLSGITFRVLDGAPPGLLFRSLELFVNALGFAPHRSRTRPHTPQPVRRRYAKNQ
jgi:AcrR family transcriptional regulator